MDKFLDIDDDMTDKKSSENLTIESNVWPHSENDPRKVRMSKNKIYFICYSICSHWSFHWLISLLIVSNTVLLATDKFP